MKRSWDKASRSVLSDETLYLTENANDILTQVAHGGSPEEEPEEDYEDIETLEKTRDTLPEVQDEHKPTKEEAEKLIQKLSEVSGWFCAFVTDFSGFEVLPEPTAAKRCNPSTG